MRRLLDPNHERISIHRQCELVGLPRSSFYYQPVPDNPNDLRIMRLLDEQYTRTPFYGIPKMRKFLDDSGECVNEKRIRRLMRTMGLGAY